MRPKCERCDSMEAQVKELEAELAEVRDWQDSVLNVLNLMARNRDLQPSQYEELVAERDRWKLMAEQMAEALERIDNRAWIHCNPDSVILHAREALAKFNDLKQKESK